MSNLKRLTLDEGKVLQISLLFAPFFADAAVSDDHLLALLIESRVEVKGQIVGRAKVQRDPEQQQSQLTIILSHCYLTVVVVYTGH